MSDITVTGLQKIYPQQTVLKDVSFTAKSGKITALLGGSGAGKSTLLRCLNLLEQPTGGSLQMDDSVLDFTQPDLSFSQQQKRMLRARVGMVFQQFNLWPHKTVLGNLIEAPIHVLKQSKQQAIQAAEILLTQVGLLDKKDSYPKVLSGGQQQRVAIARALMMKPQVMLLDEPTSALDPKTVSSLCVLLKSLAEKGMTMIMATHEMNFAKKIAEQIIFLEQGMIVGQGTVSEMMHFIEEDNHDISS